VDLKAVAAAGIGVVVTLVVTFLWTTFSRGVEGSIADNPKVVQLEAALNRLQDEFNDYRAESSADHAAAASERNAIIRNQQLMLEALTSN
jgi:uncharacterized membrane-anchored protein YhcB (DUF1043 family)